MEEPDQSLKMKALHLIGNIQQRKSLENFLVLENLILLLLLTINHSGNLNSGHYMCLVKDGETWWHCNDKAVVRVNLDDINKSLPYVLFYQAK